MSKSNSVALAIARWPLAWGGLVAGGFYYIIHIGYLQGEFVDRYFTSHPVEHVSMLMFFTGIAAIIFKVLDVSGQFASLPNTTLGAVEQRNVPVTEVGAIITQLDQAPRAARQSYLGQRLRDALDYIQRKGSADELDEHLRFASDMDAVKMHSSYALVRIIIWAIPILGFLGTVIGITMAIAKLGPEDLENSLPEVVYGLKIAFDTTALALALSIVLMFSQFFADRLESRLLSIVDLRATEELVGRFEQLGSASDPHAASVQRMSEQVVGACHKLVERQAEIWQSSMLAAQQHWQQTTAAGGKQLEQSLAKALQQSLSQHAATLVQSEQSAAQQSRQHWQEMHQAVTQSADILSRQQAELVRQSSLLLKAIEATDHISKLETALNQNLDALATEHNFEETVLSLSAAIQLLTAQLHGTSARTRLELKKTKVDANAA